MMPMKFLGLLLICALLRLRNSSAHDNRAVEGALIDHRGRHELEMARSSLVEMEKGVNDVPAAKNEAKHAALGGRELMLKRVLMTSKQKVQEEALIEEEMKISGAAHSAGKCECKGKRTLIANCKLSKWSSVNLLNDKMVGFTAFSADYRGPKSHPPRNN